MTTHHQLPDTNPQPSLNPGDVYGIHKDHQGGKWQIRWSHHKGQEGYVAHNVATHDWIEERVYSTRRKALTALRRELAYRAKKATA